MTTKTLLHILRNKLLFNWAPTLRTVVYPFFPPNAAPLFVLGNQKSGTSIIAALLAQATNSSFDIDMGGLRIPEYERIYADKSALPEIIRRRAAIEFSKGVVKEPGLTFLYPELCRLYPDAKFVFIARDPRDNIRSILNRLRIPGNLAGIDPARYPEITPMWHAILYNRWLGDPAADLNYVGRCAERWQRAVATYLSAPERARLVKYEDFNQDKAATIESIARDLGLPIRRDISPLVDVQYQTAGRKITDYPRFFGPANLATILDICRPGMEAFGYR